MAASVSLSEMILGVRRRANIENQTDFINDSELTEYINAGCQDLYDKLVQAGGQPWFRSTYTFTTVAGTSDYALPSQFYRLASVDIDMGGGLFISALPYMENERNKFRWFYQGWFAGRPVYYRMIGSSMRFIPSPTGGYSVTLNYYPVFPKLSSGSDAFDGINGWEEYVIWLAVAACKAKSDEDPGFAMAEISRLNARIEALAAQRDAYGAERINDVYGDDWSPWGY